MSIGGVILVLIAFATLQKVAPKGAAEHLSALRMQYFTRKSARPDVWWMVNPPSPQQSTFIAEVVEKRAQQVRDALDAYSKITPLAQKIADTHVSFLVSIALGGNASISAVQDSRTLDPSKLTELSFIPQNVMGKMPGGMAVYWRSDWGLLMEAVEFPKAAFAGFLYHELGHGVLHPAHKRDVLYHAPGSPEYALEECEMHELETAVMDAASHGKYRAASEPLRKRMRTASTIDEALQMLTLADIFQLDASLDASSYGLETARLLFPDYIMTLGLEFIRDKKGGDSDRIALFRLMEQSL